jgi:predicted  nucleic acid-binding Zn-ribbon protein
MKVDVAHECPQSEKLVTVVEDYRNENERLRTALVNRGTEVEELRSRVVAMAEKLREAEGL